MGCHNRKYSSVNNKFKRKFNTAFETHPSSLFNDTVTDVQFRLGDEAARSLYRSVGGGNPGTGSLQAFAGGIQIASRICGQKVVLQPNNLWTT